MAMDWLAKVFSGGKEDSGVMLRFMAQHHTPIQIEIENSLVRFQSALSLKNDSVVFNKPSSLDGELRRGGVVRIHAAEMGRTEMRLEVVMPHLNFPNGKAGFVCKLLDGHTTPHRRYERFDVSHFGNLRLNAGSGTFRLLDLCVHGCRIPIVPVSGATKIVVGHIVEEASLTIGQDKSIALEKLVPRSRRHEAYGCEFSVTSDGRSPQMFAEVLKLLETRQFAPAHAS